jgi:hypothetical protein
MNMAPAPELPGARLCGDASSRRPARFLKRTRPTRTFLEVDEFHALLDAAVELEAEGRADLKGLGATRNDREPRSGGTADQRAH